MNESALEAITTPEPNDRQECVMLIAHALRVLHPTLKRANRDDVWAEITRHAAKYGGLPIRSMSDRALTTLANDVTDVMNYLISEGK